jgi:membrane-anchored protein YejM (alkaline phosphatase superfamily)
MEPTASVDVIALFEIFLVHNIPWSILFYIVLHETVARYNEWQRSPTTYLRGRVYAFTVLASLHLLVILAFTLIVLLLLIAPSLVTEEPSILVLSGITSALGLASYRITQRLGKMWATTNPGLESWLK